MINYSTTDKCSTEVNGPGNRFVLWVQGCCFRCPGCYNENEQPIKTNKLITPEDMAKQILEVKNIEGVTFSGGEPFLQSEALAKLSKLLKPKLSVFCYTGFTYEKIVTLKESQNFLSQIDILVAGTYDESQAGNYKWRGSANQEVHFLTERYKDLAMNFQDSGNSEIEIKVYPDGRTTVTGFPTKELHNSLK